MEIRVQPTEGRMARANALRALTDDQTKILIADAKLRRNGTPFEYRDLLQGAYERWLSSEKPIEAPSETLRFLRGAMRSIASNERRHAAMARRIDGTRVVAVDERPDPIEAAPDPAPSQEDALVLTQLFELCADDAEVQMLLMLQAENAERADIMRELEWDVIRYETVQKRKRKKVARLFSEGKI
jgi:DNA-directed RNA polymerase specialized sigma24 family protein